MVPAHGQALVHTAGPPPALSTLDVAFILEWTYDAEDELGDICDDALLEEDLPPQGEPPQHALGMADETPGNAKPPSISIEELSIDTPEQHGGLARRAVSNQEPDIAGSPAGM